MIYTTAKLGLVLGSGVWSIDKRIFDDDNLAFVIPFSNEKTGKVDFSSKSNTTLGSHGFLVSFLKKFWETMKDPIYLIIQGFVWTPRTCLNNTVLSLIPKCKRVGNIRDSSP